MAFLAGIWDYVGVFLIILTVVVFIHEFGHYLVARSNGVRVTVFSVGFGPELFGWTNRAGTRWRISAVPLGGYVRMFGDADDTSSTASDEVVTEADRAVSFHHKRVGQRAAIVVAGPAANFIFAILGLAAMFMILGQPIAAPVVGSVEPGSAAAAAGLKAGDRIIRIDGTAIHSFTDIQRMVRLDVGGKLDLVVERGNKRLSMVAVPHMVEHKSFFGGKEKIPLLGIAADPADMHVIHHGPVSALVASFRETGNMISTTAIGIGQILDGTRGASQLGGPIRIAQGAGQAAKMGLSSVIFYTIILSLNLGLINLFPIPVLDGGRLVFYGIEAVLGRPLGERAQEYGFRIGLILVLALMVFATGNDIASLPVWETIKRLFS